MNILIIEDEEPAACHLKRLLKECLPEAFIIGYLDSVKRAIEWFEENPNPDLVFLDIQLADGLSFEIFEQKEILAPIIFCTAYDEYVLRAFDLNSIDYILKPIDPADLDKALDKFRKLNAIHQSSQFDMKSIKELLKGHNETYKERFVTKIGDRLKAIPVEEVSFFYSEHKSTRLQLHSGKSYPIDYTLEHLTGMLNPRMFFRLNRKYIISVEAIVEIISYSNSRLKVTLKNRKDKDVLVSREKVSQFKTWLDR